MEEKSDSTVLLGGFEYLVLGEGFKLVLNFGEFEDVVLLPILRILFWVNRSSFLTPLLFILTV